MSDQRYWINNRKALAEAFARICGPAPVTRHSIGLNGRPLAVVQRCERAIWLRFADLCERAFAAQDFMLLCDRYSAILLEAVPILGGRPQVQKIARGTEDGVDQVAAGERCLPALSNADNSVRRFIALVDECYDRGVPLYIDAAVPLSELYTDGYLMTPFRRTLSRLQAMQYQHF